MLNEKPAPFGTKNEPACMAFLNSFVGGSLDDEEPVPPIVSPGGVSPRWRQAMRDGG